MRDEMPSVCGVSVSQADHWSPKTICKSPQTKKSFPKHS